MSFVDVASQLFPGVQWHGESGIHVSVYGEGALNIPFKEKSKILYVLSEKNVGGSIWESLQSRFGKFEWLLEKDTFSKLFLVDVSNHLSGKPSSVSPSQIKNPVTGNVFHRIALLPPFVGGVRFWADNYGHSGQTVIGFRFRIVKMVDENEEVNVREESREREAQVVLDMASVWDSIYEVAEPPKEMDYADNLMKAWEQK